MNLHDVPKFGSSKYDSNPEYWICMYDDYTDLCGWSACMKLKYVYLCVELQYQDWVKSLSKDIDMTWEKFKVIFV